MSSAHGESALSSKRVSSSRRRRTVLIACLVILLGFSGVAAHALWSQTATGTITVATGAINPIGTNCSATSTSATVTWPKQGTAANAIGYSYTVTVGNQEARGTGTSVTIREGSLLGITLSGGQRYVVKVIAHYGGAWQSETTRIVDYDSGSLLGIGAKFICR